GCAGRARIAFGARRPRGTGRPLRPLRTGRPSGADRARGARRTGRTRRTGRSRRARAVRCRAEAVAVLVFVGGAGGDVADPVAVQVPTRGPVRPGRPRRAGPTSGASRPRRALWPGWACSTR